MATAYQLGPDTMFHARERIAGKAPLYGMLEDSEEGKLALREWVISSFAEAVRFKRPELERLKTCELYYAGRHYRDPVANRENKVTNLCFSTVETIHPVMTEHRPRPEIMPRQNYSEDYAKMQQLAAEWWMDSTHFDLAFGLATRDKIKYGWACWLLVNDPQTGITHPRAFPVWDYYPQAGSREDEGMEHFFLAFPVFTDTLRAQFPDLAGLIQPDGIASPGYEVMEKPYQEMYGFSGEYDSIDNIVASAGRLESESDTGRTTSLVPVDGNHRTTARTTFVIQMFVRDRTRQVVHYMGDIATRDPLSETGWSLSPSAQALEREEPVCPNGWRCVQMCADGLFLDSAPVDESFLGAPVVIDRNYAQNGRYWPVGDLDNIIPVNRSINKRYNLLGRSLEFEAVPILTADLDTGIDIDQRPVEPGDVLKKARGSQIQWMEFRGAQTGQFELLSVEMRDMDTISGVHDVQQGRRPEGIEAASAIRNLQEAAQTRIRGKEIPQFIALGEVVKKGLYSTARKANTVILGRGAAALTKAFDKNALLYEFDIRFAQGSGSALGRAMREDKVLTLRGQGLLDIQTTLEQLGMPNVPQIIQRLSAEMAATAAAQPAPDEEAA